MKRFAVLFAIAVLVLAASCLSILAVRVPHIPNKVTAEEYAVYSAWTEAHFSKNAPDHLYLRNRTFKFDPLGPYGCGNSLHNQSGVSWSLIKQLSTLGDAEYQLDFYTPTNPQIPWKYEPADVFPGLPPGTVHMLAFSRVAFNRGHSQALFAISDACAPGLCGKGGAVVAQEQGDRWTFRSTACNWVY